MPFFQGGLRQVFTYTFDQSKIKTDFIFETCPETIKSFSIFSIWQLPATNHTLVQSL